MPKTTLGQSGVNELLLSAVILNMLSFMVSDDNDAVYSDPYASWVFSPDPNRLGWLSLQAGLRPLLISMPAYLGQCIKFLDPIFIGPDQKTWLKPGPDTIQTVPKIWLKAFSKGDILEEVYRGPLLVLAQLRHLEPHTHNVYHAIGFFFKVYPRFLELLFERDVKALWAFGYWLGLMCRFEGVWWWEKRVRCDYEAIKLWLLLTRIADQNPIWAVLIAELQGLYVPTEKAMIDTT